MTRHRADFGTPASWVDSDGADRADLESLLGLPWREVVARHAAAPTARPDAHTSGAQVVLTVGGGPGQRSPSNPPQADRREATRPVGYHGATTWTSESD